jgi:hypothetical protein
MSIGILKPESYLEDIYKYISCFTVKILFLYYKNTFLQYKDTISAL